MNSWICLAVLIVSLGTSPGYALSGRVVRVADGDTITALTTRNIQVRVRLAWIDAPEKGQAFSNVARESLSDLVAGKTVQVEEHDRDRYGRTVGIVFVDGQDVKVTALNRTARPTKQPIEVELRGLPNGVTTARARQNIPGYRDDVDVPVLAAPNAPLGAERGAHAYGYLVGSHGDAVTSDWFTVVVQAP
jgi:Staphylococcal nuclease homologue